MYLKYKIQQSICIFKVKYLLIVIINMPKNFSPYLQILRCVRYGHQVHPALTCLLLQCIVNFSSKFVIIFYVSVVQ